MSTTNAPPQQPPAPSLPPASDPGGRTPGARTTSRVIAILVIVLGALIAVGTITSAVWGTVAAAVVRTSTTSVPVDGVDELTVDVGAGSLRVQYGDVSEATLEVTGDRGADEWTFERRDDVLVLESPDSPFGVIRWFNDNGNAVLTLPDGLERSGLDGDFHLAAGSLEVKGGFGDLYIEMGAGSADVTATARSIHLELSAGSADLDLTGVTEADFEISAGAVDATISGRAPTKVAIDVSAGGLDLTLPDGTYDVRGELDRAAGDLDNRLDTSSTSSNVVEVQLSAGQVTLRHAR